MNESVLRPLKRIPGSITTLCLIQAESLLIFTARLGRHGVGLGPLSPQGEPLQLRDPSLFLTATDRCGTYPIHISAPPTSLIMASSLYPSYRTSIQLASRWFSVMVSL